MQLTGAFWRPKCNINRWKIKFLLVLARNNGYEGPEGIREVLAADQLLEFVLVWDEVIYVLERLLLRISSVHSSQVVLIMEAIIKSVRIAFIKLVDIDL